MLPRNRIERPLALEVIGWGTAALLLALGGLSDRPGVTLPLSAMKQRAPSGEAGPAPAAPNAAPRNWQKWRTPSIRWRTIWRAWKTSVRSYSGGDFP